MAAEATAAEAVVFGYALGAGANVEHPKAVACMTDGMFYQVANAASLGGAMSSYYTYFAASQGFFETRWISYTDVVMHQELLAAYVSACNLYIAQ